jgi:GH15 family glucan-1,4-alpha-glucosidase
VSGGLRSAAQLAVGFGEGDRARRWAVAAEEAAHALSAELCPPGLGRFARSLDLRGDDIRIDATLDAGLLWVPLFADFEASDPRVRATVEAVRERLWLGEGPGGLLPHDRTVEPHDRTGGDRPSVPATLWLAQHAARSARTLRELDTARTLLLWCAARAGETGLLPERLPSGDAGEEAQAPAMLAHACFVRATVEYEERYRAIQRCDRCGAPARARRAVPELAEGALPGIVAHQ